jgi:predicted Zn-dependent protease
MTPVYYEPPRKHDQQMKSAWVWLAVFFGVLAILLTLFVLNARSIVVHLPFSAEQRFVRPYEIFAQYVDDEAPSAEESFIQGYLQELADALLQHMDLPPEYAVQVHYLDSDEVNAFAMLGGHILVFRGLIESLPDENSLAMVMAHEIGHIKNRDPIVSLGRGVALQLIYSFVTGGGTRAPDVASYGGNLGILHFSREQEREADRLGVAALQRMYGHVGGLDTIFSVMLREQENSNLQLPEWLSTHPDLRGRIRELNDFAIANSWSTGPPTPFPDDLSAAVSAEESASRRN